MQAKQAQEVVFTIDISGEVEALRGLPDGAGTAAFVAAYNARHPDAGAPPAGDMAIRFRTRPLAEATVPPTRGAEVGCYTSPHGEIGQGIIEKMKDEG